MERVSLIKVVIVSLLIVPTSWDEVKAPGASGLEQTYDFVDMLGFCGWLHVLVRKHKDVGIACLAQTVNVVRLTHCRMNCANRSTDLTSHDSTGRDAIPDYILPVSSSNFLRVT